MTSQALPAWNVVRIKCPVSAAWRAISAVALSRISPMAITSGSWRNSDFSPDSSVSPTAGLTCACAMPAATASTGSSSVARLRSPGRRAASSRRQA